MSMILKLSAGVVELDRELNSSNVMGVMKSKKVALRWVHDKRCQRLTTESPVYGRVRRQTKPK
jgi:hypothetical protein